MNCPHCKKEIRMDLYNDTPGAVFVACDTNETCFAWPAIFGIKKYEGCIEFGRGVDTVPLHGSAIFARGGALSCDDDECMAFFGDIPHEGEAWLVKSTSKGWDWERVDDQIEFSIEGLEE